MPSHIVHPAPTDDNAALQAQSAADGLLRANQAGRIACAVVGNLLCWVPFRQLTRHGELAASVLVADVVLLNALTAANAALWPGDDWAAWWDGAGLCDAEVWLAAPLRTVYAAAIFAVMRRLACQLASLRAPPSPRSAAPERRRRRLAQALVIFPVPLVQLAATWFVLAQRYLVGALVGCSATYDSSWPKILLYSSPPALFALGAVPYAILTWRRFRALAHTTAAALGPPANGAAAARAARMRCRLYQMALSILVPYVPLMLAFFAVSVRDTDGGGGGGWRPYSYHRVHHTADPYPWDAVMFVPSWLVPPEVLNQPWLPILTTVPIVLFFGLTPDALATYRRYARALGLHRLWPGLRAPPQRLPVDAAKLDSALGDSHGSHHWFRHGPRDRSHQETEDGSQNEPNEPPVGPPAELAEPPAPADAADALERGRGPRRPRRPPLDADAAPPIPPRTSSRLAALFGRRSRGRAVRAEDDPPRRPGDHDGVGSSPPPWPLPPWPLPPLAAVAAGPGETRIRIQTPGAAAAPRCVPAGGRGPGTVASMSGEDASLTDETATDSLGARLHRAGSQPAIRRFGLPWV